MQSRLLLFNFMLSIGITCTPGMTRRAHAQEFFMVREVAKATSASAEHQQTSAPGPTITEQKFSLAVPVYRREHASLSILARGERTELGERLLFSNQRFEVPQEFGTAELGLSWVESKSTGDKYGASFTYGSAGTRVLDNGYSPILTANLFWERPTENGGAWVFFLSYANSRAFLNKIPLPGAGYMMSGPTHRIFLGLPFIFANWRTDPWSVTAIVSPFLLSGELAARVWGPLQLYTNASWMPKAYQNLLKASEDRVIFDRREATLGARLFLGRKASLSLAFVHGFNRRLLIGRSVFAKAPETVALNDSSGVQLRARFSFE